MVFYFYFLVKFSNSDSRGEKEKKASRLSKVALFTIFKRVLKKRRLGTEATETTYYRTKRHARDYQKVPFLRILGFSTIFRILLNFLEHSLALKKIENALMYILV